MDLVWTALFCFGVFLPVYSGAKAILVGMGQVADWRVRLASLSSLRNSGLSDSLQKWVLRAEKELGRFSLLRRGPGYVVLIAGLSLAGMYFGAAVLRNPAASVILAVLGVIIPEQIVFYQKAARKEKLICQLSSALYLFAAEFSDTPHPVKALGAAASRMEDPIGEILKKAEKGFLSGKDTDEVLIELAKDLDFEYGRLFVQLLRLAFEDESVKPLFSRLAVRVSSQQDLIRKSTEAVSSDRIVSLILNIAPLPVFFIIRKIVPEAYEFFTATAAGRAVIAVSLLSVAVGALLDRIVNRGVLGD